MPGDSVKLICPNLRCRSLLSVPAAARGKTVRCGHCGSLVKVPAAAKVKRPEPVKPEPDDDATAEAAPDPTQPTQSK